MIAHKSDLLKGETEPFLVLNDVREELFADPVSSSYEQEEEDSLSYYLALYKAAEDVREERGELEPEGLPEPRAPYPSFEIYGIETSVCGVKDRRRHYRNSLAAADAAE